MDTKLVCRKDSGIRILSYESYDELVRLEKTNSTVKELMKKPKLWLWKLNDECHNIQKYIKEYKIAPKHFRKLYAAKHKIHKILEKEVNIDFYSIHTFRDMVDHVSNIFKFYKTSEREAKYMFIFLKIEPTKRDLKISFNSSCLKIRRRRKKNKFRNLLIILIAIFYTFKNDTGAYFDIIKEDIEKYLYDLDLRINTNLESLIDDLEDI